MDNILEQIIIEKVKDRGKITFAEFMDIALYYPGLGYYQKENPFGTTGSFYTSVNASEKFGFSLARSILHCIKSLRLDSNICEMGAGSGMLANDVLNYYREYSPEFYEKVAYYIIEKSSYLIERQKEILSLHKDKVKWLKFEELKDFNGVFFSNELVDAFPVHRVIKIDGELKELYVIFYDGKLQFYPDMISDQKINEYIENIKLKLVDKQIADLNICSAEWIVELGKKLKKGIIITIDYGFTADKLYAPFRMDGTVTCYFKHTQNNDFFERIGFQDITAFVDFTVLDLYGRKAGLDFVNLLPQSLYLVQSGLLDFISFAGSDLEKAAIKSLIVPEGGFGTNFHVLIQSKDVSIPPDFMHKKSPKETYIELISKYEKSGVES